jgi:hypothetical protein
MFGLEELVFIGKLPQFRFNYFDNRTGKALNCLPQCFRINTVVHWGEGCLAIPPEAETENAMHECRVSRRRFVKIRSNAILTLGRQKTGIQGAGLRTLKKCF